MESGLDPRALEEGTRSPFPQVVMDVSGLLARRSWLHGAAVRAEKVGADRR